LYLTGFVPATLPLDHPGLVRSAGPRLEPVGAGLAGGVVAVRLCDLAAVDGVNGAQVLVPASAGRVGDGDLVAWCTVTAVAPAVYDAGGHLAADGWLPDQVRLGVLEEHLGRGAVEQVVAGCQARPVEPDEVLPRRRLRLMSLPLVARLVLAMTLLPQASYVEALAQLVGVLPRLPWARAWQVPSSTVVTAWRRRLGVDAMKAIFDRVAGPVVAATDPAGLWHGLRVAALDGCQARVADTPANRAAFGSAGTADDGCDSPFPLVRIVLATARAGRAILAAALDASRVGEQTLTARLVADHPHLFTPEYLYVVDRNFLSHSFIDAVHQGGRGAHLLMRVKDGIRLPVAARLGPGQYLSYFGSGPRRIKLRVVEYDIRLPDGTVTEVFCLATTLLDHHTYPVADIAEVYRQRWSASETTIGEAKSTITDAGPSRGPILRSEEPDLVRQEAWAWLTATQLVRKTAHAATRTTTGIRTDQTSFTTTRREATRSMVQSLVTATSSPAALAHAADLTARGVLSNLVTVDRDRHSPRRQKCRPRFPHTAATKTTTRGPLKINLGIPEPDTS
jgi:hypothetical protein